MDAQAREQWYNSLEKDYIPAVSEANILNTFEQLYQSKDEVFERGVINVFKSLSRDFKTNNPCQFGSKIIVNGLVKCDRWGYSLNWSWQRDRLADLERMLMLLDGKPVPDNRADVTRRLVTTFTRTEEVTVTRTGCLKSNTLRREHHISHSNDLNWWTG